MILRLGGVPLRIGAGPIKQLAEKVLPLKAKSAALSLDERMVYVATKTAFLTIMPWLYKRLRALGIDAPPPICPKGADYNNWATLYAIAALVELGKDVNAELTYQELPDGSLLLTGVAPAVAGPADDPAPAQLSAPQIPDPDEPDDEQPAPGTGGDDRSQSVGPLVHPGPDWQRQDPVRETPDPRAAHAFSNDEPLRAGQ